MAESIYVYERRGVNGFNQEKNGQDKRLIIALNLSNNTYKTFKFGVDEAITIKEILNSDYEIYGGHTPYLENETIKAQVSGAGDKPYFIDISLAPFSAKIFEVIDSQDPQKSDMKISLGGRRNETVKRDRARRRKR